MQWTIHTQGPDEPVYVIEAEGMGRFIALLDGECKTRAEVLANAFLLASAPRLLEALRESLEAARLAGIHQHPDGDDLPWYTQGLAVIAEAKRDPCDHNEMVPTGNATYAWKCAKCGYVYGKEN
jgi:hypothetical protein